MSLNAPVLDKYGSAAPTVLLRHKVTRGKSPISAPGVCRLTLLPLEQGLIPAHCRHTNGDTAHIGTLACKRGHPFPGKTFRGMTHVRRHEG